MCIQGLNTQLLTIYHPSFMLLYCQMESKHKRTNAHCNLNPIPTPPPTPTPALTHSCTSLTPPLTSLMQTQCQPGQLLLLPCSFRFACTLTLEPMLSILLISETTVFECEPIGLAQDQICVELFKDRGWLRTGFGKQTSGCPALCPGRTQHEAAHSLTPVDPSQT